MVIVLTILISVTSFLFPAFAGITPNDILVVYNDNQDDPQWAAISRAVADYYCSQRGIPDANKCPLDHLGRDETIEPRYFGEYIYKPLMNHLITHFGATPDDPSSCRIKCIVLCYGIPVRMTTATRYGSVDTALVSLFEHAPWGNAAIGPPFGNVVNPYKDTGDTNYLNERGNKPCSFSEFRDSSFNDAAVTPPNFTVIRYIDATHAIAGGEQGMVYRGEKLNDQWVWTETLDENKDFVAYTISDFSITPSMMWTCTGGMSPGLGGSVLSSGNEGADWTTKRIAPTQPLGTDHYPISREGLYQMSFYDNNNGWCVGRENVSSGVGLILKTINGGNNWDNIPPPAELAYGVIAVAAVDAGHIWVGGSGGIFFRQNNEWVQQSGAGIVIKLSVRKVGASYVGWAACSNGIILHTLNGCDWHQDSHSAGTITPRDLAVWDQSHAAIAYGQGRFLKWQPDQAYGCGGCWIIDSSDPDYPKDSVAIDIDGNCIATCGNSIRVGYNSGGTLSWSESYTIPEAHLGMRFLVCRLDGHSDLMTDVIIGGQTRQIPLDIRNMIDKSLASDGQGSGRFILDYKYSTENTSAKPNLEALVGSSNVKCDFGDTFLINEPDVMGYFCYGNTLDEKAELATTFGRPFNFWVNGAIGIDGDGYSARELRKPDYTFSTIRRESATDQKTCRCC